MSSEFCKVHVTYHGAMRGMVKKRDETIVLSKESASIRRLLEVLSEEYGARFGELTKYSEHSSPLVTIFVNGVPVGNVSDSEKPLPNESQVEVALVNQMSGG